MSARIFWRSRRGYVTNKEENTKRRLTEFSSMPVYFEFSDGEPEDAPERINKVTPELIAQITALSKLSGKKFESEFAKYVVSCVKPIAENALHNDDVTLYQYFLEDYIKAYTPELRPELEKETTAKLKISVKEMIEDGLKNDLDYIHEERFIKEYVEKYAPEYLDVLKN